MSEQACTYQYPPCSKQWAARSSLSCASTDTVRNSLFVLLTAAFWMKTSYESNHQTGERLEFLTRACPENSEELLSGISSLGALALPPGFRLSCQLTSTLSLEGYFVRPPPIDLAGMFGYSAGEKPSCIALWVTEARKPSHHVKIQSHCDGIDDIESRYSLSRSKVNTIVTVLH